MTMLTYFFALMVSGSILYYFVTRDLKRAQEVQDRIDEIVRRNNKNKDNKNEN